MEKGANVWFCNTVKTIDGTSAVVSCHLSFHLDIFLIVRGSTAESSDIPDLSEEEPQLHQLITTSV